MLTSQSHFTWKSNPPFCLGLVLCIGGDLYLPFIVYGEVRLDQCQLFDHRVDVEMIQCRLVKPAFSSLIVKLDDLSAIDVQRSGVFVEPAELIKSDLMARQSQSLKDKVRSQVLHLSDELCHFENLFTRFPLAATHYLIVQLRVIRANDELNFYLGEHFVQVGDKRGDFTRKTAWHSLI